MSFGGTFVEKESFSPTRVDLLEDRSDDRKVGGALDTNKRTLVVATNGGKDTTHSTALLTVAAATTRTTTSRIVNGFVLTTKCHALDDEGLFLETKVGPTFFITVDVITQEFAKNQSQKRLESWS